MISVPLVSSIFAIAQVEIGNHDNSSELRHPIPNQSYYAKGTMGLSAYGGLCSYLQQNLTINYPGSTQVGLEQQMPLQGVMYTPANSLIITTSGDYEINFMPRGTPPISTTVAVSVYVNGADFANLTNIQTLTAGMEGEFYGSGIVTLPAGAVVELRVWAIVALTLHQYGETG